MSNTLNFAQANFTNANIIMLSNSIDSDYSLMLDYCSAHDSIEGLNISLLSDINLSCEKVILGQEQFKELLTESVIENVYYHDYDCDFWKCLSKTGSPFFFISNQAREYWHSKFYLFLMISLILAGLLFFITDHKTSFPIVLGTIIVLSSLPLIKLADILLLIFSPFLKGLDFFNLVDANTILSIIKIFFTQSFFIFWFMISLGIILILFGFVWKFWNFFTGNTKKMFSKKEVENLIKKVVSKDKSTENKKK
jgi:hypothetical protein